jgi:hypothetical protein
MASAPGAVMPFAARSSSLRCEQAAGRHVLLLHDDDDDDDDDDGVFSLPAALLLLLPLLLLPILLCALPVLLLLLFLLLQSPVLSAPLACGFRPVRDYREIQECLIMQGHATLKSCKGTRYAEIMQGHTLR